MCVCLHKCVCLELHEHKAERRKARSDPCSGDDDDDDDDLYVSMRVGG